MPWRPVVSGIDLTDLRAWLVRTWNDNRLVTATGGAALLAILAVVVSAGAFGAPQAAAGLPPTIGTSTESFGPAEPGPASDPPSAAPSGEPVSPSPASPSTSLSPVTPSEAPSVEPQPSS
jgi:hypothetical protein